MLQLRRTGRNEATLTFDASGGEALVSALQQLQGGLEAQPSITADLDNSLIGRRNPTTGRYMIRVAKQEPGQGDASLAREQDSVLAWRFVDAEGEIEYAISRLSEALAVSSFSPAEFMMLRVPKSSDLVRVLAEFVAG